MTASLNSHVNSDVNSSDEIEHNLPTTYPTIVAPLRDHTHTVIFLHGREDFGEYLAKDFFDYKASDGRSLAEIFPSIKWVFPTAKLRYSARRDEEFSSSSFTEILKGEEIISQWFDIWDIETPDYKQELMVEGLKESIVNILDMVHEEMETISLDKIILGGMSQGCATAVFTLLSSGITFGGFIGVCSWLPFQQKISNSYDATRENLPQLIREIREILRPSEETNDKHINNLETALNELSVAGEPATGGLIETPIFLAHSRDDEIVPFYQGQGLYDTLRNLGACKMVWKEYEDGGHSIHPKHGVDDIEAFLHSTLKF
jgi:lysophospholipase-2